MDFDLFDRQILLFGRDGQDRIAESSVTIVGLGGIGSHIAQQLAFVGVRKFALIDADIATKTSRNRLIGMIPADIAAKTPKVRIAERLIKSIEPDAEIRVVHDTFVSEPGFAALKDGQVIIGAVDRDGARLLLTEFACAYDRPYFDLATDTDTTTGQVSFGGRLMIRTTSKACPFCLDLLDMKAARRDLSSPQRRGEEDEMYGVRRDALDDRGPSVVSLNGIIASIAVMEFIVWVTGMARPVKQLLRYDGIHGIVNESKDAARPGCPYCTQTGKENAVDWQRHIRGGLGGWLR